MNPRFVLIPLGIVIPLVLVMGELFFALVDDKHARGLIADIIAEDAKVDASMLKAHAGFAPNYDELVAAGKKLHRSVNELRADAYFKEVNQNGSATAKAFTEAEGRLVEKEKILDAAKYNRAVSVNSSSYLSEALAAVDTQRPEIAALVRELEQRALAYGLAPRAETRSGLLGLIKKLQLDPSFADDSALYRVALHATKIAESDSDLAKATDAYLAVDTAGGFSELSRAFESHRDDQQTTNNGIRQALIGFSSLLLGAIALVLRRMASVHRELSRTKQASQRFVPEEFLKALGKGTLLEVKSGDSTAKEMSVLFSDVREFTRLSERLTPEETFKLMNRYHTAMETPIHASKGFVNEYRGDGMMALFPLRPDDAIRASVAMYAALEELNRERTEPIRIGIGINSGNIMLGTFGGENRMNAGVISDAVNLASRVESLTKTYGCRVLITEDTWGRVRDKNAFTRRLIDKVEVKGSSLTTMLYEILDAEEPSLRERKRANLANHEQAMQHYFAQRFAEARKLFQALREVMPEDPVYPMYVKRCDDFEFDPPPKTWSGVFKHESK